MRVFTAKQVCDELGITIWTLTNWYQWERLALEKGEIDAKVLPVPTRLPDVKGRPRLWDESQIKDLKIFQSTIVVGRNGFMGYVTNPKSRQAKHRQ